MGDLNLQAEPTWRFDTGPVHHTLVTGFELRRIDADTERATSRPAQHRQHPWPRW